MGFLSYAINLAVRFGGVIGARGLDESVGEDGDGDGEGDGDGDGEVECMRRIVTFLTDGGSKTVKLILRSFYNSSAYHSICLTTLRLPYALVRLVGWFAWRGKPPARSAACSKDLLR